MREVKAAQGELSEPVTVMVRGGKYYPQSTLDLRKADSGTDEAPVIYAAFPGETPVISGGRRVTEWTPYKGEITQCHIPEAMGGMFKFRQLFADGRRQVRARYPAAGSAEIVNFLITAYCPVAVSQGASEADRRALVAAFANAVTQALY